MRLSKEEVLSFVGPLEGSLLRNVEEEGVLITKMPVISVYNSVPAFSRERAEFAPGTPSLRSEQAQLAHAVRRVTFYLRGVFGFYPPSVFSSAVSYQLNANQPTNQPRPSGARTAAWMVPAGVAELGSLPCEQARLAHAASR